MSGKVVKQGGYLFVFFFNDTATTEIYTLSLHDALPIYSTLGKHKICSYQHLIRDPVLEQDHIRISGANRGKALFICNKQDREADKENRDGKGWEYQYHDTMCILKDYLHLDVSETERCTTAEHKGNVKKCSFSTFLVNHSTL